MGSRPSFFKNSAISSVSTPSQTIGKCLDEFVSAYFLYYVIGAYVG